MSPALQATLAFMTPESCRGDVMRDLRADWRRWTRGERVAAVFIAIGMTSLTQRCSFWAADNLAAWSVGGDLTWIPLWDRFSSVPADMVSTCGRRPGG